MRPRENRRTDQSINTHARRIKQVQAFAPAGLEWNKGATETFDAHKSCASSFCNVESRISRDIPSSICPIVCARLATDILLQAQISIPPLTAYPKHASLVQHVLIDRSNSPPLRILRDSPSFCSIEKAPQKGRYSTTGKYGCIGRGRAGKQFGFGGTRE